jgi:hypothetical protein
VEMLGESGEEVSKVGSKRLPDELLRKIKRNI